MIWQRVAKDVEGDQQELMSRSPTGKAIADRLETAEERAKRLGEEEGIHVHTGRAIALYFMALMMIFSVVLYTLSAESQHGSDSPNSDQEASTQSS